jgi:hypothetical protein
MSWSRKLFSDYVMERVVDGQGGCLDYYLSACDAALHDDNISAIKISEEQEARVRDG